MFNILTATIYNCDGFFTQEFFKTILEEVAEGSGKLIYKIMYKEQEVFSGSIDEAATFIKGLKKTPPSKRLTYLDELAEIASKKRKKVFTKNVDDIGKQTNTVGFKLVDELGDEFGTLKRTMSKEGDEVYFDFELIGKEHQGYTQLMSSAEASLHDFPIKNTEKIIYGDINISKAITDKYSGIGKIILDDTLAYLRKSEGVVDGVIGNWKKGSYYDDYGGQSINLKQFWKGMDIHNGNVEKAAFETFTGSWAKENGFTRVEYLKKDINEGKVIIKFLKP